MKMNMMPSADSTQGLGVHANGYLFDTSLTDAMRSALSNTSILRSWDYEMDVESGTKDLIHAFAEQIDDMTKQITNNAAVLLDEFELSLSSPTNYTDSSFLDVATLVDEFRFNESNPSSYSYFNISLVSTDTSN